MENVTKGMLAGLAATVVLSIIMFAKAAMGLMPSLRCLRKVASLAGRV